MNKSRIALAIAGALGAAAIGVSSSAVAQTSTVQIGGGFNLFYMVNDPGGNTPAGTLVPQGKKHDNLQLSEPELWIHGEETMGAITTWFRCTTTFDVVSQTTTGVVCGRNSGLGFKGGFGNLFFGNWDSPHKLNNNAARGWFGGTGILTGGFAQLLYNGSGNTNNGVGNTFYERRPRGIHYHSPSFGGFNFKAVVSSANEETGLVTATTGSLSSRTLGASAEYANGPLQIGVGYEQHNDNNPASQSTSTTGAAAYNAGTDKSWNIAGSYTMGFGLRLGGIWSQSKYDVTNTTDLKKSGWALFADYKISGPHSIKAQYYKAGDSKGTSTTVGVGQHSAAGPSTGAKGWTLAYGHELSKRTEWALVYGVMDNEANANYLHGARAGNAGSTQKNYGLNIRHKF